PPGGKATVPINLPADRDDADALAVRVDGPDGRELWTWVWGLRLAPVAHRGSTRRPPLDRKVRIAGPGELTKAEWRDLADGGVELNYAYTYDGAVDFHGISFDLPEKEISSMRWLGQGPFRVWKNRPEGGTLNVWETHFNETMTGYSGWNYPEFE